jgi:hypothetical protein
MENHGDTGVDGIQGVPHPPKSAHAVQRERPAQGDSQTKLRLEGGLLTGST